MKEESDKYNSIPFPEYLTQNSGVDVIIDNDNRVLKIVDLTGNITSIVHFSVNIDHSIEKEEILDSKSVTKAKAYFVYKNGTRGFDWLWHYGGLIPIEDIFN